MTGVPEVDAKWNDARRKRRAEALVQHVRQLKDSLVGRANGNAAPLDENVYRVAMVRVSQNRDPVNVNFTFLTYSKTWDDLWCKIDDGVRDLMMRNHDSLERDGTVSINAVLTVSTHVRFVVNPPRFDDLYTFMEDNERRVAHRYKENMKAAKTKD